MSRKAFDKIAEGLTEALAVARGEAEPARLHVPEDVDVKGIRKSLGMSQDTFAQSFAFSINQIRDWEQGRSRPLGANRAYLTVIARAPEEVLKVLRLSASQAA